MPGKCRQRPDNNGPQQNDFPHFLDKNLAAVPHMNQQALGHGHAVRRQLHYKGGIHPFQQRGAKHSSGNDGENYSQNVNQKNYRPGTCSKKRPRQHDVDRQLGRAGHKGRYQDGQDSVFFTFQRTRGHDGRDIAPKSHEHGDK